MNENTKLLELILHTLRRIEAGAGTESPNYRRRLAEFDRFNWSSIGATVIASDERGPADVEWRSHRFDRVEGDKFEGHFIIFSRPAPGWTTENKKYYTLIRFADYSKVPLNNSSPMGQIVAIPATRGSQITPLDVQRTTPASPTEEALEEFHRENQTSPPTQSRPAQAATVQNPRAEFYSLGSQAMNAKRLDWQAFNALADTAKKQGFEVALEELQQFLIE